MSFEVGLGSPRDFEVVVGARSSLASDGTTATPKESARRIGFPTGVLRAILRSRWTLMAGPLLLLIVWELVHATNLMSTTKLPAPIVVFKELGTLTSDGQLGAALSVSVRRVVIGLLLGVSFGSGLALVSGLTRIGEKLIDADIHMFRTMPVLALLPLFIIWFGIGEEAKVLVIATAVTFPIYINLFAGIRSVDSKLIEAGEVLGLSRLGLIRQVIIPGALPQFLTGLRLAMGVSWLVLVAAEELNATSGLGYMIMNAQSLEQTNVIFALLIVYSMLGIASDLIIRFIERWALAWRSSYVNR